MRYFRAFYENAAATEAAARAEGYDGNNGSLMDYVEPSDYRTGKDFKTLEAAVVWLKEQIEANKTVFGCGNVIELEPVARRCRYCVCGGIRRRHEHVVDHDGLAEDFEIDEECCD